jgi:sterol desaturase/sphingolipid hydroxylase (fatty acid hydroxylase superfamily)
MDRPPASTTALPDDGRVRFDDEFVDGRPVWSPLKTRLVNLAPPVMLVAAVLFWGLAPKALVDNPWSLLLAGGVITAIVLAMEVPFERHAGWRLNWREFLTDLFYVVLTYTVIAWATQALAETPLKALKETLGIATPWLAELPFLVQAAIAVFLIEFGQYWMHRLMHAWQPFWLTHAPHHHITQLNAMKGWVGNPIELFLISLSVLALLDFETSAVFCAITVLSVVSTFAHANVRADPPAFYSFFFTTIRNHSLHHSVPYEDTRCNYANSLILIDRVLGTYREGEACVVGQEQRKRLSIKEQFLFPFQPAIDRYKAKQSRGTPLAH